MKIGIMQPYFFPYIGYWQLINAVDKYVIYDDVNFIKGGWINRNNILMNGKPQVVNLQMKGASSNKKINEIEVFQDGIYSKKILKTITLCYNKAPYFKDVFPIIEEIINQDEQNLAIYLENSIRIICNYLKINTEILVSSQIKKKNNLKGEEKVIEICKNLNGTEYYNAIGGQKLYSYDRFNQEGIELKFLKTEDIKYKQYNNEFTPCLSIIDVMMFNSISEIRNFLAKYTLL